MCHQSCPPSALDYEMRLNLQDEILKAHHLLNSQNLLVSHDKDEVFKLADTVVMLRNGAITANGKPSVVFENLSTKSGI